jgi:shikimate kinase
MGAGKSTLGEEVARRLARPFRDLDREVEARLGTSIAGYFAAEGEEAFRRHEAVATVEAIRGQTPSVFALGGGAIQSPTVRDALREHGLAVHVPVDAETAWTRVQESGRPLAHERAAFFALHDQRAPLYEGLADATARDADDVVLQVMAMVAVVRRGRTDDLGSVSTAWTNEHNAGYRGGDGSASP